MSIERWQVTIKFKLIHHGIVKVPLNNWRNLVYYINVCLSIYMNEPFRTYWWFGYVFEISHYQFQKMPKSSSLSALCSTGMWSRQAEAKAARQLSSAGASEALLMTARVGREPRSRVAATRFRLGWYAFDVCANY